MGRSGVSQPFLCARLPQVGYKLLSVRQVPSSISLRGKSHLWEGVVTLRPIGSHPHRPTPQQPSPPISFSITLTPLLSKPNMSCKLPWFSINFTSPAFQCCLPVFKTEAAGRRGGWIHTGQAGAFSACGSDTPAVSSPSLKSSLSTCSH